MDDLKEFVSPAVERIDLEDLSAEAGAQLLTLLGVKGTPQELTDAVKEFDGHALALTLLGRYLAIVYNGDVRQRDKIARLTQERRQAPHARRVMESYARWFEGKPERDILHIMGVFDRPVERNVLEAVTTEPTIEGLTSELVGLSDEDWAYALDNLMQARLLARTDSRDPNTLDCHPLVREYFGEKLEQSNPAAWTEAHGRLFEYYKAQPEKYYPDTLEDMDPLFEAVIHGCHAGRHQEAYDEVYQPRIQRGDAAFSTRNLGAFGADLAALSGFFDRLWVKPVMDLPDEERGKILTWAAFRLRPLGRIEEAIKACEAAIAIWKRLKKWDLATRDTINVSLMLQFRGNLLGALRYAELSVESANRIEPVPAPELGRDRAVHARAQEADVLHQLGRFEESEKRFREAVESQQKWPSEPPFLYSYQGFQYRNLLLDLGDYQMVIDQTQKTEGETIDFLGVRGRALNLLLLGRAHLLQALREKTDDFSRAEAYLENAVYVLRQSGYRDTIPDGLIARAQLHRVHGAFARAQLDLEEALSVAERDGMGLHLADTHLEYARLYLAMGEKKKVRESLAIAKEMMTRMSYHRRDREVAELENALSSST